MSNAIAVQIMLTKADIVQKLEELKPELYEKYGVKSIGLFGSFSDNSFNEESDIDLLVELERPIGWDYFKIEPFLEHVLGRKVDIVTKNALKAQTKDSILEQLEYI